MTLEELNAIASEARNLDMEAAKRAGAADALRTASERISKPTPEELFEEFRNFRKWATDYPDSAYSLRWEALAAAIVSVRRDLLAAAALKLSAAARELETQAAVKRSRVRAAISPDPVEELRKACEDIRKVSRDATS